MAGVHDPMTVVKMPAKELASESAQLEREKLEMENLAARRTDWH